MMRVLAGVLSVVVVMASGCVFVRTSPDEVVTATIEPHPAPPEPPGVAPTTDGPDDELDGELVTPTPGMEDLRAVAWDQARVDGTTVTVSWWGGAGPCHVLDRVEVEEGEDVVVITVYEGSEPSDEPQVCDDVAQRKRTVVELEEPVGQRSLLDGAEQAS